MGVDGVDVGGVQAGVGQGLFDDALLGGAVGRGEAVGGAVGVDGGAADDGEDGVAVAAGVGEALDQEQADAFGPSGAVGVVGERLAAAVGGEAALPAELEEQSGGRHDGDAAGQGEVALPRPQGLHRPVEGDQGGGAGGVDGDGGALQAKDVGDAAGGDGGGVAGEHQSVDVLGDLHGALAVAGGGGADEDAGGAGAEGGGRDAGPFEEFPGRLQEQPLLGVGGEGLAGAHAEEAGVERGGVAEEAALAGGEGAGLVGVGVEAVLDVPAAVGGQRADGVAVLVDEPPQVLGGGHRAGEAAAHRHDGDGLALLLLHLVKLPAGLPQLCRHPLEVLDVLAVVSHVSHFLDPSRTVSAVREPVPEWGGPVPEGRDRLP